MDCMAAQSRRLARQVPADSLDLRRYGSPHRSRRESLHSCKRWNPSTRSRARAEAGACRSRQHRILPLQNRSRVDTRLGTTHWEFNGWAKYPNHKKDEKLPAFVAQKLGVPTWEPQILVNGKRRRVVLEGGSIDVNGLGTMLTTEECLLSEVQQRNRGVAREQLEQLFSDYLGAQKTIWLGNGIAGDDTHGHVDDISRFVSPDTLVTVVEKNTSDPNHAPLQENLRRLRTATDQNGKKLNVVELPLPSPVWFRGQRLPASYANFYVGNAVVLVPTFNDANDRVALNILKECFPQRDVVGIYCGDFIWGLGAIHCATQQQPR